MHKAVNIVALSNIYDLVAGTRINKMADREPRVRLDRRHLGDKYAHIEVLRFTFVCQQPQV